jgi:ubiquinone/menaquinone biosynthesis C-methylase UbiE
MGSSHDNALSMMDGSPSEEACQLTGRYMAKKISNALLINQNDVVLELGCGIGRIGREIAPLCGKWLGADISRNLIEIAKQRISHLKNVDFSILNKTSLQSFPDHFFDKAYSHAVFIHIDKEDIFLYLREIARVLKPGGLLYFDTWNLKHELGWERWMMEVEAWAQTDQKERKHVSRNQFSTPNEISLYVEKSGFLELFSLSDSFWIQEIALKFGEKDSDHKKAETMQTIHQRMDKVAINSALVELFGQHLKLLKGQISPTEFHCFIWNREENEEVSLYRQWFSALWKKNEKQWGPIPKILD